MMAKWAMTANKAMIARSGLVLVLTLAFSVVETENVQAQCGAQGGGYGYGYDIGRLYRHLGKNVPHFAAYPPVYYSAPIPRTYGYSPFAYPPGTRTPDLPVPMMAAKEILNPFVKSSSESPSKAKKADADRVTRAHSTVEPLTIVNSFAEPSIEGPALHAVALNR